MKLKNYQEELVINTVRLVLEDRTDIVSDDALVHDIAAYTLNRMPPKYIMSERGFTRLAPTYWLESSDDSSFANLVELVLLVNRAIDIIQSRRRMKEQTAREHVESGELFDETEIGYWHNYPHLIGKIENKDSGEVISGVSVTLYIDGVISEPAEPGWQNPYLTNRKNQGFYSFWPRPAKMRDEKKESSVEISFEHPDFVSYRHHQIIQTVGGFEQNDCIKPEEILNLGTISLSAK